MYDACDIYKGSCTYSNVKYSIEHGQIVLYGKKIVNSKYWTEPYDLDERAFVSFKLDKIYVDISKNNCSINFLIESAHKRLGNFANKASIENITDNFYNLLESRCSTRSLILNILNKLCCDDVSQIIVSYTHVIINCNPYHYNTERMYNENGKSLIEYKCVICHDIKLVPCKFYYDGNESLTIF